MSNFWAELIPEEESTDYGTKDLDMSRISMFDCVFPLHLTFDFTDVATDNTYILIVCLTEGSRNVHFFNRFTHSWAPPIRFPAPFDAFWNYEFTFKLVAIHSHTLVALCTDSSRQETYLQYFLFTSDLRTISATKRIALPSIHLHTFYYFPEVEPARISCLSRESFKTVTVYECTDKATKLFAADVEDLTVIFEMMFDEKLYILSRNEPGVELYLCSPGQELELITTKERCFVPPNSPESGQVFWKNQVYSCNSLLVLNIYFKDSYSSVESHVFDVRTRKWISRHIELSRVMRLREHRVRRYSVGNEMLVHSVLPDLLYPKTPKKIWYKSCKTKDYQDVIGMTTVSSFPASLGALALRAVHRYMPQKLPINWQKKERSPVSKNFLAFCSEFDLSLPILNWEYISCSKSSNMCCTYL